jgi:hypothetical protein
MYVSTDIKRTITASPPKIDNNVIGNIDFTGCFVFVEFILMLLTSVNILH